MYLYVHIYALILLPIALCVHSAKTTRTWLPPCERHAHESCLGRVASLLVDIWYHGLNLYSKSVKKHAEHIRQLVLAGTLSRNKNAWNQLVFWMPPGGSTSRLGETFGEPRNCPMTDLGDIIGSSTNGGIYLQYIYIFMIYIYVIYIYTYEILHLSTLPILFLFFFLHWGCARHIYLVQICLLDRQKWLGHVVHWLPTATHQHSSTTVNSHPILYYPILSSLFDSFKICQLWSYK
jgi:hypothetical protein